MMKKLVSLLMALCIVLSMVPAFAAEHAATACAGALEGYSWCNCAKTGENYIVLPNGEHAEACKVDTTGKVFIGGSNHPTKVKANYQSYIATDAPTHTFYCDTCTYEATAACSLVGDGGASGDKCLVHCTVCNDTAGAEVYIYTSHAWISQEGKAPTCTDEGYTAGAICKYCGTANSENESEEIPALGHTYVIEVLSNVTCTLPGRIKVTCAVCGKLPATPATGTGSEGYDIPGYGKVKLDADGFGIVDVSAGHNYEIVEITKKAACAKCSPDGKGVATAKCTICGDKIDDYVIPALEHVEATLSKAGDCVNPAQTGTYCVNNRELLEGKKTAEEIATWKNDVANFVPGAHKWVATATKYDVQDCFHGAGTLYVCNACGAEATAAGLKADGSLDGETKPLGGGNNADGKPGHDWVTWQNGTPGANQIGVDKDGWACVKLPTCYESGLLVRYCDNCDAYETKEIAPLEHKFDEKGTPSDHTDATCTKPGTLTYDCVAASKYRLYNEDLVATNNATKDHYWQPANTVPANPCVETKTVINKNDPIDPTKHVNGTKIGEYIVAPNCKTGEAGVAQYVCVDCGAKIGEPVKLTNADDLHIWGEWTVVEPATCLKAGVKVRTCTVCGKQEKGTVAQLTKHDYVYVEIAAACGKEGFKGYKCTMCEATDTNRPYTDIPATAQHNWQIIGKEYVCNNGASVNADKQLCSNCGAIRYLFGGVEVKAAHNESNINNPTTYKVKAYDVQKATCIDIAITGYKCETCGYVYKTVTYGAVNDAFHTLTKVGGKVTNKNLIKGKEVKATCSECSYIPYTCLECGAIVKDYTCGNAAHTTAASHVKKDGTLYADKHNWEITNVIQQGDCESTGIVDRKCSVCGKVEKNAEIKAMHKEAAGEVIKAATCEEGEAYAICSVCGIDLGYTIKLDPIADHNYVMTTIEATCEDGDATTDNQGYVFYICSVCGEKDPKDNGVTIPALTHKFTKVVTLEETCENEAGVYNVCEYCGVIEPGSAGLKNPATHNWTYSYTGTPTCLTAVKKIRTCNLCGKVETVDKEVYLNDEKGHKLVWNEDKPYEVATLCNHGNNTEEGHFGYAWMICETCGYETKVTTKYAEVNTATNALYAHRAKLTAAHKMEVSAENMLKAPDCKAGTNGVGKQICVYCGYSAGYGTIPYEHDVEEQIIEDSTCAKTGTLKKVCKVCGKNLGTFTIKVKAHEYETVSYAGDCSLVKAADVAKKLITENIAKEAATIKDVKYYQIGSYIAVACKNCGEIKDAELVKDIPAHTYGAFALVDETCDTDQRFERECSVCGYVDSKPAEGAKKATGHSYQKKVGNEWVLDTTAEHTTTPATCKTVQIDTYVCDKCGEVYEKKGNTYDYSDNGHDWIPAEGATLPTCEKTGKGDVTCSLCGTTRINYTIPKLPHTWSEKLVDSAITCIYQYCTVCGEYKVLNTFDGFTGFGACTISADGKSGKHTLVYGEGSKEADCVNAGYAAQVSCSVCGEILAKGAEIPALGHTEVAVEGKEANCTETGLTAGTKCSVCGEWVVAQEVIPALGHTEKVVKEAVAADCLNAGMTAEIVCSVCGITVQEAKEVAALGHVEVEIPAVAADCDDTGLTAGVKCAVCGEILKAQEVVAALGHKEVAMEDVAPTYTTAGSIGGKKCSVCGVVTEEPTVVAPTTPKLTGMAIMRDAASQTGAMVLPLLAADTAFTVIAQEGNFYNIMLASGATGYIHVSYVA